MGAIKGRTLKSVECPICFAFSSKKLTSFEKHLNEAHGTTTKDLWDLLNNGPVKCACGCNKETRWGGWWSGYSKVINGHNGFIYSVHSAEEAEDIKRKRSNSLKGKSGWAKGRTKENDERIKERGKATARGRKRSFETGNIQIWNKGLTKETDERVKNSSLVLKEMFQNGEIVPWAKGLTIKDEKIKKMSEKVSISMRQENLRKRLDDIKRLSHEEIKSRVESSGSLVVVGGLENYINDAQKIINVSCKNCGKSFISSLRSLQYGKCFNCSPGGSKSQEMLANHLKEFGFNIKRNDRKLLDGLEIDILIEGSNVGIEYNGLYWHCYTNKSSQYHNNKTKQSLERGIKLIHVFEDEWRDKKEIIESIIISKAGKTPIRVGARKCSVKELTNNEKKEFFNQNHIDGDAQSTISWGLIFNNKIVYAISLRKPFHKKEEVIEIARCCPAINHNVQGGLGKLINVAKTWAKKNFYKKLITYVDTRLGGTGLGYKKSGFEEINITPPRFWWTDFENRFNRFRYRANKSKGLTESQVAESAGVVKIWGCENIVYSMNL